MPQWRIRRVQLNQLRVCQKEWVYQSGFPLFLISFRRYLPEVNIPPDPCPVDEAFVMVKRSGFPSLCLKLCPLLAATVPHHLILRDWVSSEGRPQAQEIARDNRRELVASNYW